MFDQNHWSGYPQSQFPNWTPDQTGKSGIKKVIEEDKSRISKIFTVNVMNTGKFEHQGSHEISTEEAKREYRNKLQIQVSLTDLSCAFISVVVHCAACA